MRARYGLAAAFVVVVVALILVRDQGYLGGRADGGPLEIGLGGDGARAAVEPGRTAPFTITAELDGEPVEVQRVRPDFMSPGMRFRAARLSDPDEAGYPRRGDLLVGSEYDGAREVRLGFWSEQPGVYYALGLIVDSKRGIRRFRHYDAQELCVAVGREAECRAVTRPDVSLAELGGPSRYGAEVRDGVARVERGRVRLTLSNLGNRAIEVDGLEGVRPDSFKLRRGGGRTVRVDLREAECGSRRDELSGRVDGEAVDVPLTTAIEVRC